MPMTDMDLAATVTRLRRWTPPEGIHYRIILAPEGDSCRVTAHLSTNDVAVVPVVFTGPPDHCQLAQLTELAESILDDARSLGPIALITESIPRGLCDPNRN